MHPTPAILVTGAGGAEKQMFVRALLAARPAGEHWAVLDNDNNDPATLPENAQISVAGINGCMCCTGQLALQVGIVQLLRRSRPQRLIIVVSAAAEPALLERALQQGHLASAITINHRLCVVAPPLPAALPPPACDLLRRQMTAADHVVAVNAASAATLRATGIAGVIQMEDAIRRVLTDPPPASSASSRRIAS